jgi:hypothetical protein
MIYLYIVASSLVCYALVRGAKKIGSSTNKEWIVFLYILMTALCGLFHYRLFLNGEVGPIFIDNGPLLDISSFLFFIFVCVVPVSALRKGNK